MCFYLETNRENFSWLVSFYVFLFSSNRVRLFLYIYLFPRKAKLNKKHFRAIAREKKEWWREGEAPKKRIKEYEKT